MTLATEQQVIVPRTDESQNRTGGESLTIMGYDQLLREDFAESEIVSGGVLGPGRTLLILGAPKAGKTILALNLAIALAQGTDWLGFDIPDPQKVLYLSGEGGPGLLQARLKKMIDPAMELPGSLSFWWPRDKPLMLEETDACARIAATIERSSSSVVILDPLIRFHSLDENSTRDMSIIVGILGAIRRMSHAAVVIVHHARKPGMGSRRGSVHEARGSSVLHGDIDSALVLYQRRSKKDFTADFELRWGPEPPGLTLSLDEDRLLFKVEGEKTSASSQADDEEVLQVVREMGECTSAQLADKIGKNKRTVQRRMEKFEDSGRVTHRTGENGTKIWSIPQAEK